MSLLRNTLTQSSLTMSSRILGFVRDILIAAKIGAGSIGDAFVTALILPNLFRRIFAEGAFAQAFVPAYARTLEAEGKEAAEEVARQTMRGLFASHCWPCDCGRADDALAHAGVSRRVSARE